MTVDAVRCTGCHAVLHVDEAEPITPAVIGFVNRHARCTEPPRAA